MPRDSRCDRCMRLQSRFSMNQLSVTVVVARDGIEPPTRRAFPWPRACQRASLEKRGLSFVGVTVVPDWVKSAVDRWLTSAAVASGRVFRAVSRHGTSWGDGISENVVWYVGRTCAQRLALEHLAPHDLRRTCAKLCHVSGGELEQIQFLLGHASVLTTERYLGCRQNIR